jgi:galactokinase
MVAVGRGRVKPEPLWEAHPVPAPGDARRAYAPGRVNLIGDHTDYNGGLALPMAIQLGVEVVYRPAEGDSIVLTSDLDDASVVLPLDGGFDGAPGWGRLAAAVLAEVRPPLGGEVAVTSDLPAGAGLSSSAAFSVALALALGATPVPIEIARLCQRAEHAVGVPVGLMDPLVEMLGRDGHAVMIDFSSLATSTVEIPGGAVVLVVDSGTTRNLETTAYAERRAECEAAAAELGRPLSGASPEDIGSIGDQLLRRRARHVVAENARVRSFVDALGTDDLDRAGALMNESHASLRDDFEVSCPELDRLTERMCETPGVLGARLTGGGFGGCVVGLCRGVVELDLQERWWRMHPSAGAWVRPA